MKKSFFVLIYFSLIFTISAQDITKKTTTNLSSGDFTLDCKVDVNLGEGFTTSKIFMLNNEEFLFSHNSKTGQTSIWNLKKGGNPVYKAKWSEGWTNIEFYQFKSDVYFFHQKTKSGLARINKLDYTSIMSGKDIGPRVFEDTWSEGWTTTKFFVHNDIVYFLHYKKDNGLARLNAATTGGSVGTKIYEKTWSKGYTNFAMTANRDNFYILYQQGGEGNCVINQIDLQKLETAAKAGLLSPNLGTETYRQKWTSGWGNICFFNYNKEVYMFLNKPSEGTARIEKLNPNGTIGDRFYDKKWTSGWTEIDIFYENGKPQLFHQKVGTGQTKICELKL